MMKIRRGNLEWPDDKVEGCFSLIDITMLLNLPAIKHFLYKHSVRFVTILKDYS